MTALVALLAAACDLNATTSSFSAQLAAAQPGQTICMASGDYGSFSGVTKTSPGVTLTPATGATPKLNIQFRQPTPVPAWLIFDGLTITGGELSGPSHDLTFKNCTFTDKLNIWGGANNNACSNCPAMNNNHIVFDNDLFNMADNPTGAGGYEGRVNLVGGATTPAGVVIKGSKFTTGCADGVQVDSGGNGVTIGPGNEFFNIQQGSCGPHVDSIQFVGSSMPGPTIIGNYFHDESTGIVAYDYDNDAIISDNVMIHIAQDPLGLGGSATSIIEHNTVVGADIGCGYTHEGNACLAVFRNNLSTGYSVGGTVINGSTGSTPTFFDYNLCTAGPCTLGSLAAGPHSLQGAVTYSGGAMPSSYAGFQLTASSLGHGAGSDGLDMGVRFATTAAPQAPTNLTALVH